MDGLGEWCWFFLLCFSQPGSTVGIFQLVDGRRLLNDTLIVLFKSIQWQIHYNLSKGMCMGLVGCIQVRGLFLAFLWGAWLGMGMGYLLGYESIIAYCRSFLFEVNR